VLFVGRILPHKGIDVLIEALDRETELTVVGRVYHEPYYALLRELALGKQVEFVTSATDADLIAAYQSAAVTVLPSVYVDFYGAKYDRPELLGLVLLESMACGTPVICSDVGGMPEYVADGVTGFVVPPRDPEALAARIGQFVANDDMAQQMGDAGRDLVRQRYTWDHVAHTCLDIYQAADPSG